MDVTVIIPTLNRAASLQKTLESLVLLDYNPGSFEILILDNGSSDNTKILTDNAITANPHHKIRYICEPTPGLLSVRHKGAFEAQSDLLVFIDDDIIADKGWLTGIVDTFKRYKDVHLVCGKCLPNYEKKPPSWLEYFWKKEADGGIWCGALSLLDFGDKEKEVNPTFVWGLNFSIRKKTLFELGGFNPDSVPLGIQYLLGDGETGLSIKAIKKGYKAMYQPKALVHHEVPASRMTLEYFDKRYFFQGICDSYTHIRENGGLKEKHSEINLLKSVKKPIRKIYKLLIHILPLNNRGTQKINIEKELLLIRFKAMENAGYQYHRQAAQTSEVILKWICKENYLDYKLPLLD